MTFTSLRFIPSFTDSHIDLWLIQEVGVCFLVSREWEVSNSCLSLEENHQVVGIL